MTKKDYQAIARAVYLLRENPTKNEVIMRLSDVFVCDNARFDASRFEEACITGKTKGMR